VPTNLQLALAFSQLGISPEDFIRIKRAPTHDRACRLIEALKARAKVAYRRAALELHPDRNGGDRAKTEQFKLLATIYAEIEKMQPPPSRRVQVFGFGLGDPLTAENLTSTPFGDGNGRVRVTIRYK